MPGELGVVVVCVFAGSGLDEFQRITPESVVVTSPSNLTHMKGPHPIVESEFLQSEQSECGSIFSFLFPFRVFG